MTNKHLDQFGTIATILAVALLTVGFQTMKVVLKNPVEHLKHE